MKSKYFKLYSLIFLFSIVIFIFYATVHENKKRLLTISFFHIGKGDAILIVSPTGNQILVNSGSNKTILSALGNVIPFYDRSLDAIIATEADEAYVGGMPDILKNYSVKEYFSGAILPRTGVFAEIAKDVSDKNIQTNILRGGEMLDIGDGAHIQIISVTPLLIELVYKEISFYLAPIATSTKSIVTDGINIEKI